MRAPFYSMLFCLSFASGSYITALRFIPGRVRLFTPYCNVSLFASVLHITALGFLPDKGEYAKKYIYDLDSLTKNSSYFIKQEPVFCKNYTQTLQKNRLTPKKSCRKEKMILNIANVCDMIKLRKEIFKFKEDFS